MLIPRRAFKARIYQHKSGKMATERRNSLFLLINVSVCTETKTKVSAAAARHTNEVSLIRQSKQTESPDGKWG